ncbi:hypothetical protein DFH05DRAFT_1397228 [Lentinula detonsa]|uniref:Retrotransposon gag domain-containing protein n=1 Tax=Lentinula detonsa TaxID=2804962 RepID=A0A9W8P0J0_9AGAR|nr:hypothetical protein DFH05DRAFT_1397228 [Lentinula detonsa]
MSSTTPIPLPSQNERSAPQFDPKDEAHLPAFFDEFERVAKAAGIEGDTARMKKEVLKYVDSKTMKYWRSLESYTDAAMSWPEFRKEVTGNYPDAVEDQEANIEDLRKVIASFKKQGIKGNQELATYHREFAAVASILKSQGTLSEVQLSHFYVSVLTTQMQQCLDVRLQIQYTAKKKGEAFRIEGSHFLLPIRQDSHSIRGINAIIGERTVHCIDDGGCSIVAMSDACANVLGIAFDPSKVIPLQSANGQTNYSLGLAKDVPFQFCGLTAFLQVHIVPSPAYDVLLGRPFQVLMQAVYKNFLSGDQHVTLIDPNTHNIITIPTVPQELPRFRKGDGRDLHK